MVEPLRTVVPQQRRGAFRLTVDPVFGGLFWGKLLSSIGVWVHGVVAAIVVFASTHSALAVGLVSVCQFAPQLLLTPLSGTMADKGHVWGQMLGGRILCCLGSLSLAAWFAHRGIVDGWSGAIPVLAASLLVGLGFVLGGPAQQSVIPRLVRADELPTAMMLNTTPMTVARIAGPAVGAVVAGQIGPAPAFAIAAGTHLVFAVIIAAIRFPRPEPHRDGVDYSVRAALRHVWHDKPLLLLLIAVTAAGVGSEPTITLAPALAHSLHGNDGLVGGLTSCFGLGAGLGLMLVTTAGTWRGQSWVTFTGLSAMSAGMFAVTVAPFLPAALIGFAVAGFGFTWTMSAASTMVQQRVPDSLRGRVMAFWMIGFVGGRPMAAAALGGVADATDVHIAIGTMCMLLAVAAMACRPKALD